MPGSTPTLRTASLPGATPAPAPATRSAALVRMAEAEETLRAIGAGEVDAFVVSDAELGRRVFMLSTADRPYRIFVENMRDGAATVSPEGVVLYANGRLAELLCRPRETIVGLPLADLVAGELPAELGASRNAAGRSRTVGVDLLDAHGAAVPVLVGMSPLEIDGDELTCLTFTDLRAHRTQVMEIARLGRAQADRVAELQIAQAALVEQATHDELTGLPNRGLVVDRIDQALFLAKRSGRCTAVIFVDLDRFKLVNDTRGHAAGDIALCSVADTLVAALRPMDTVARIGGDEFVVLAPDVDSPLHAAEMSTRLVNELRSRSGNGGHAEAITASLGVSVSLGGRGTAEILLDEADKAMYKAKSRGGARAELFDAALGQELRQRSIAQRMLRSALDDGRIIGDFQPIVDLQTGTVAGFEALVRMVAPGGAIVPPADFIPVAEESGLVTPLGSQILALACQQAQRWQAERRTGSPLTVAVNLSARQFEPGDLAAIVGDVLKRTGLDPSCLHLELTETALIDVHPRLLKQLGRIRDLGVELGLDDFGTGYASLTHLRRLPLTFVKIDRSFVEGLCTDHDDERIVAAVVDLAANLGLRSIAEGVETDGQLGRLRELGCDQAQGFLFARPLPSADVATILRHPAW